ncbi:MAG: hypothetical protein ACOVRN_00500 [Flavobacterium sp.]
MSASKKPCCKVCQDAGKPEEVYTSHWVKDLTGKTVCPTLLNAECRFCHKLGHTTKYCKELEKMNKEKERAEKKATYVKKQVSPVPKSSSRNMFAAFCDDDENSDSEKEVPVTHKPEPVANSWANIAAKPKEQKPISAPVGQRTGLVLVSHFIKEVNDQAPPKAAPWASKAVVKKSWADESDDEDDEDEDDLPEVNFEEVEMSAW